MSLASEMWQRLEPIHSVTYFSPGCREAFADLGLKGFWMGYFAGRAAPMGAVTPAVIEATFFNFPTRRVRRAIPDAWAFATVADVLSVRSAAAAEALRGVVPDAERQALRINQWLEDAAQYCSDEGRPLGAVNRQLPIPHDPVAAMWQHATTLREHRGDGHVAVLTAEALTGCEVHVITSAYRGVPAEHLQLARGWTVEEWAAATDRLQLRGWLDDEQQLTPKGWAARDGIEARTDRLAAAPYDRLGAPADELLDLLTPVREAIMTSGVMPFPNPIGLPHPGETRADEDPSDSAE